MFRRFIVILCMLFLPWQLLAQGDTGVQARVLPNNTDVLLEIVSWHYENISDSSVKFIWESNLPAIGKIEFGDTWLKGDSLLTDGLSLKHELILNNLYPGTLYYFNLSVFNDNDSSSLGDNTFKTSGQRKILDPGRKLEKVADENLLGASKKPVEISLYSEYEYNYNSDELFLLEDISIVFIIFSLILVLFLIYKKLKRQNEEKKSHWEKLDK